METKTIIEHREIGKLQDSLEIGSPSKGGAIKVYVDFKNEEECKRKIDAALMHRAYLKEQFDKQQI